MSSDDSVGVSSLERFRRYLHLVARLQLGRDFRGKLEPSDVVQQTLLEAYQKRGQYRGNSEGEWLAWLRQVLTHNLADAIRALGRAKRGLALQRSLEAAADESSLRWQAWLADGQTSPSGRAERNEELLLLAEALAELPEGQRETVVLHHLQGASLVELAAHLGRSEAAVAGLLHRGLKALRDRLQAR